MAKTIGTAHVLWIDADPVFGGSRSQIQFPAELSSFFSLPADPGIGDHVSRAIHCAGLPFPAKKMDFHHNDVWRLNLPTTKQGLGGYPGKLLVFEKSKKVSVFTFWMIEKESSIARRLRTHTNLFGSSSFKWRDNGTKRRYGYY